MGLAPGDESDSLAERWAQFLELLFAYGLERTGATIENRERGVGMV